MHKAAPLKSGCRNNSLTQYMKMNKMLKQFNSSTNELQHLLWSQVILLSSGGNLHKKVSCYTTEGIYRICIIK